MFHFLSISNLNTSKGTFVLLDAAELLLKQTTNFHIHFVGAPTAEISAERMHWEIESRGLQRVATYHGRQYGEDKEARFAEADCFVHPTLDDCFPLVILEAMQHSLPVISTPVGAIPDMVVDGETGRLASIAEASVLAESMATFKRSRQVAEQMGKNGCLRYTNCFMKNNFENTLLKILKQANKNENKK